MSNPIFPVDIGAVRQYGIERWQANFFWPVSDKEFIAMCSRVEECFAHHINTGPPELADILLLKRNLFNDYVHFFHAVWVLERIRQQGYTPLYGKNTLWYKDINEGRIGERQDSLSGNRSRTFPNLKQGNLVQLLVNNLRTWKLNLNFAKLCSYLYKGSAGSIYGIPDHLLVSYLRKKKSWYSIVPPAQWVPARSLTLSATQVRELNEFAMRFVQEVIKIAFASAVVLSEDSCLYLKTFTSAQMIDGAEALWQLRNALRARSPAQVLLPAVGAPLQRAIALAVRHAGGQVITFAHGGSVGLYDVPTLALSEFALADEFVAYTQGSLPLFECIYNNHPPLRGNKVKLVSADDSCYSQIYASSSKALLPPKIKKVMIIAFPHNPWRKSHGTATFSLMQLDLELRMARLLKDAGYEVIYKAHPDRLKEIEGVFDSLATVIVEDFKHSCGCVDAYIFGSLRTTAFPIALCTNKPILTLEMRDEYPQPFAEAWSLLKKRCTMIPAWFDERNRVMFSEEILKEALIKKPEMPNMEFACKYLFA